MALAEQVLEVLQRTGPLDDDQLGAELGVSRQSARAAALRLVDLGAVIRERPAGGKWMTAFVTRAISPPRPARRSPELATPKLSPEDVEKAVLALYGFTQGYPPKGRLVALESAAQQRGVWRWSIC
jgi:hypothetical protein